MAMLHRGEIIEVLVVDDASTDATAQTATDLAPRLSTASPTADQPRLVIWVQAARVGRCCGLSDADVTVHDDAGRQVAADWTTPR